MVSLEPNARTSRQIHMSATRLIWMVAVLALVAAACGDDSAVSSPTTSPVTTSPITTSVPGSDAEALAGTSWVAISMNVDSTDFAVVAGSEPSIEFGVDGRSVTGSTGCNIVSGDVSIGGGTIRLDEIAITERGCLSPDINDQEARFLSVLAGVATLALDQGVLELSGSAGSVSFTAPGPIVDATLDGTTWRLDTLSDGVAATSILSSTQPRLFVDVEGGSLRGTTGCNDFGGSVDVFGGAFSVSDLSWTEIGCESGVMTQEAFILDVLVKAERFDIEGDRLTISAAGGNSLIYRG